MTAYKKVFKGFTLIELLIVMAILGVLAVVVLVAVNPAQQLARTRDTGRKSAVTQLGRSLEAYFTGHNGFYVADDSATGWITDLQTAGEISTVPTAIAYSITGTAVCTAAAGGVENGYCYVASGATDNLAPMIVYARMESTAENSKCAAATPIAWFVYSSEDGRGGVVCTADAATVPAAGAQTYAD